ncbi:MAG: DUF4124 domain-containing protein [Proteobacteria bacterium]|nr:DUF4124 domain-containing protein [Pseudomonadota bacterium]
MRICLFPILLLAAVPGANATDVYKCTDTQGNVAFQDQPCPANATQTQVWLPDTPPAPPQPAVTTSAQTASDANPPPPTASAVEPPAPLPPLWICRKAEDGSTYFSRNGSPPVRYVPLGMLGFPGHSLSQAYGPGGIGVSAPGMRQIPIDHSPGAAAAADYTPLQDECVRASREQTCGWLQEQYDDVTRKLRNAFKDQQAIRQPQADELESQLNGC